LTIKILLAAFFMGIWSSTPAHAHVGDTGFFNDLTFVAQTRIAGPAQHDLALCHTTYDFRLLGLAVTRQITGFALSIDRCQSLPGLPLTTDEFLTAQSLGLIDASVPLPDQSGWQSWLHQYGLWAAVGLAMFAVVIRRMKALLGIAQASQLRKRAAKRILAAMCHVSKCDGVVTAAEIALIADTAQRLTGRVFSVSEISHLVEQADPVRDHVAYGHGLRDHEKDLMLRGVLSIAIASGRIFPEAYEFAISLAHGLGIPAKDFRRVLRLAISDMNTRGT